MIYTPAICFIAVVIIALILIHRDNQRLIKNQQAEIQQHITRLRKI